MLLFVITTGSPLFSLSKNSSNLQTSNSNSAFPGANITSGVSINKPSGFLFNRNEAQKLLYTPVKRSRPGSPKGATNFGVQLLNSMLPSRRSPSPNN